MDIRIVICVAWLAFSNAANAQDSVTYRTESGTATIVGTIVDFNGQSLRFRASSGGERPIPSDRVISVQTRWHPQQAAAEKHLADGQYEEALQGLLAVLREEPRLWVQRRALADYVLCLKELGQIKEAGEAFLQLVRSDPMTLEFHRIPLSWQANQPAPAVEQWAVQRMQTEGNDTGRLIGASWLLSTRHRADAIKTLGTLSSRATPRIAMLAGAQLWRTRVAIADLAELQRWRGIIEKIPIDLRGGPYFTLGKALATKGESQAAAIALMRVPVLYAVDDRQLAAAALLSAGRELEKIEHIAEAVSLYREILRDYRQTSAAAEATTCLERLGGDVTQN